MRLYRWRKGLRWPALVSPSPETQVASPAVPVSAAVLSALFDAEVPTAAPRQEHTIAESDPHGERDPAIVGRAESPPQEPAEPCTPAGWQLPPARRSEGLRSEQPQER
jgi:hypothetical protein